MSDEEFKYAELDILILVRAIKDYCKAHDGCKDCMFHNKDKLSKFCELSKMPELWRLEIIEKGCE